MRAMAATFNGAPVQGVPPAFLDDAFDLQGKFKGEAETPEELDDGPNMDDLVGDPDVTDGALSSAEEVEEPLGEQNTKTDQELMDEKDTEGMAAHWVQVKSPGAGAKLRLPPGGRVEADALEAAHPRCGLSGQFDYVGVEEAMVSNLSLQLCRRCCPRSESRATGCAAVCGHVRLRFKTNVVSRCFRRCAGDNTPHEERRCDMHRKEPEREGSEI